MFSTLAQSHDLCFRPLPKARLIHFAPMPPWGLNYLSEVDGSRRENTPHCHGPSPLYRRWAANHYDYGEEPTAGSKRLRSLPLSAPPSNPKRDFSTALESKLCTRGVPNPHPVFTRITSSGAAIPNVLEGTKRETQHRSLESPSGDSNAVVGMELARLVPSREALR